MLTDSFVNLSCAILLDDNSKFTESIYNDIHHILEFYNEEEVPLSFRKKFQLAKTLVKLRTNKLKSEQIVDNLLAAGHFTELDSFISAISKRKIDSDKIDSAISQIQSRKQYVSLLRDVPKIDEYIKKFNTNEFTDIGDSLQNWTNLIVQLHSRILEQKRLEATSSIRELDLTSDSYNKVLDQIEASYTGQNSISTGYIELDGFMNGGFEPTRLYIYGGSSGDGKSVLLNNFLRNAVELNKKTEGPPSIYTYYTLENLVDESLVRLYCSITEQPSSDLIRKFSTERRTIEEYMKEWQLKHNSIVIIKYFPPTLTSVSDLISYSDLVKERYKDRGILRCTYVDYLDLLRSGQTFDLHRLEMGQVTIDMKVAAVLQSIPWITVSQLNRGAYDPKELPTLANMSESIKKVEHADFVALIKSISEAIDERADVIRPKDIGDMSIFLGKNRSGPKNVTIKLKTKFSQFRIDDNSRDRNPRFEQPRLQPDSVI
jgi:replicative DNA helicase